SSRRRCFMQYYPVLIFMSLHVLLAIIGVYFVLSEKTSLRKEHIIPMIMLPIIGPLVALIIEALNISGEQGKKPIEQDHEDFGEDILWKTLRNYQEKGNLVPLEEAILINDVKTRRKYMLETLYEDPLKYLDVLML